MRQMAVEGSQLLGHISWCVQSKRNYKRYQKKKNLKKKPLGRVVREVRQHPEDHEFESQWWQ
jgi:hypothetical protein